MRPKDQHPVTLMRRERRAASPEQRPDTESRQETGTWPLLLMLLLLFLFPFFYDLVQGLLARAAWR